MKGGEKKDVSCRGSLNASSAFYNTWEVRCQAWRSWHMWAFKWCMEGFFPLNFDLTSITLVCHPSITLQGPYNLCVHVCWGRRNRIRTKETKRYCSFFFNTISTFSKLRLQTQLSRQNKLQRQLKSWKQYHCGMWTWDWRETTVSILEKRTAAIPPSWTLCQSTFIIPK